MTERRHTTTPTNAGILLLRFLGAHTLSLILGIALSLLTLPLWTGLLYRIRGEDASAEVAWGWYLLVVSPFYFAFSTLVVLVLYAIWTGASDKLKSWQRVLRITLWIHLFILLAVNLILGSRTIP